MFESGKSAQIAPEISQYHLSLLGLCKTRKTKAGQLRLATGDTLLYSDHDDEGAPHTEGVDIRLSEIASKALMEWKAVSSRIIIARFYKK